MRARCGAASAALPPTPRAQPLPPTPRTCCAATSAAARRRPPQGTIGKRLEKAGIDNTAENRRAYRELFYTAPGIGDAFSGVIMFKVVGCAACTCNCACMPAATHSSCHIPIVVHKFHHRQYTQETLVQAASDGTPFVQVLARQGVLAGIKVDEVRAEIGCLLQCPTAQAPHNLSKVSTQLE